MSRVFAFVSVLLALAMPATLPATRAGATVNGSVVDAQLRPLAGALVSLDRDGRVIARATSDAEGAFVFKDVSAGAYRVRVEAAGFPALSRDLVILASATTLKLPIVLSRPEDRLPAAKPEEAPAVMAQRPIGGAGGGRNGGGYVGGVAGGVAPREAAVTAQPVLPPPPASWPGYFPPSGERYTHITPHRFESAREHPLSTFGADVDTASYSNVRRFLSRGQLPPREAVRVEEMVNYFHFDYPDPRDGRPIGLTTEIGECPWAPSHKLVLIGARAKAPASREIGTRNIVLLIDVSGSMAPPERLPLIKSALGLFVDTLRPDDRLSIVTYAGTSGVALFPTEVRHREVIQQAIANLYAGGSTNGGQGLIMAYRVARESFIPGGVNRVILATDGDFNVGIVSQRDLLHLIERERESGVFLSVFGVGTDNLKDRTMEMLADHGNGHYAYLDTLQEARRVLIREGEATLETVAKDVKFQVEFNPAVISAWKLIGYEDRALAAQDFNDDRKDAGEMGAGHTVTVLYEVIPVGAERADEIRATVDPLKYQAGTTGATGTTGTTGAAGTTGTLHAGEWMTVKARYKLPESDTSELITTVVRAGERVRYLPVASTVVEFGLLLRDTPRDLARWDALDRRLAGLSAPGIPAGDWDGFKELVATARGLARLR